MQESARAASDISGPASGPPPKLLHFWE